MGSLGNACDALPRGHSCLTAGNGVERFTDCCSEPPQQCGIDPSQPRLLVVCTEWDGDCAPGVRGQGRADLGRDDKLDSATQVWGKASNPKIYHHHEGGGGGVLTTHPPTGQLVVVPRGFWVVTVSSWTVFKSGCKRGYLWLEKRLGGNLWQVQTDWRDVGHRQKGLARLIVDRQPKRGGGLGGGGGFKLLPGLRLHEGVGGGLGFSWGASSTSPGATWSTPATGKRAEHPRHLAPLPLPHWTPVLRPLLTVSHTDAVQPVARPSTITSRYAGLDLTLVWTAPPLCSTSPPQRGTGHPLRVTRLPLRQNGIILSEVSKEKDREAENMSDSKQRMRKSTGESKKRKRKEDNSECDEEKKNEAQLSTKDKQDREKCETLRQVMGQYNIIFLSELSTFREC